MARRKRSLRLEVSLFAFQDIIISVTGVLILIILLLVLEITNSITSSGLQEAFAASAAELRTNLEQVDEKIDQIVGELGESSELVNQAIQTPESLLDDKIREEKREIEKLEEKIAELDSESEELKDLEQKREQKQNAIEKLEGELASLLRKKEQLEKELEALSKGEGANYLAPRGVEPNRAWLCDVSATGLKLMRMEGSGQTILIPVENMESNAQSLFKELNLRLRKQSPVPEYILFVIRPSGAEFSDTLSLKGDQLRPEIGMEFISEQHVIFNQERK